MKLQQNVHRPDNRSIVQLISYAKFFLGILSRVTARSPLLWIFVRHSCITRLLRQNTLTSSSQSLTLVKSTSYAIYRSRKNFLIWYILEETCWYSLTIQRGTSLQFSPNLTNSTVDIRLRLQSIIYICENVNSWSNCSARKFEVPKV